MKNTTVLLLLLLTYSVSSQTIRYVTVAGGGTGTSTASTWTFAQLSANATCNMTAYVQVGNYGTAQYSFNLSCTSGTPFKIIAVDNSWNPIVVVPTKVSEIDGSTHTRATYTHSDAFSGTDLPYLNSGLGFAQNGTGTGLTISGSYITIDGFAVRGYNIGFIINGSNHTINNINADFNGLHSDDNYDGFLVTNCCTGVNINVGATNSKFTNIFARDGSHIAISDQNGSNDYDYVEIYTTKLDANGNSTDYQFLLNGGGSTVDYAYIFRELLTWHLSHGYVIKPQSGISSGNILTNIYAQNSKIELQGTGAQYNTIKNAVLVNKSTTNADDYYATQINILNGAHHNTLENIIMWQPTWGVLYENFVEGYANDADYAGNDNIFKNLVVINPWSAHIGFVERNAHTNTNATNENYYHSTFVGGNMFYRSAQTGLLTGGIYNSIMTSSALGNGSAYVSSAFVFDKINTPATLTPYTETNITNLSFSFLDAMASNSENISQFDYSPSTTILDIGANRNTIAPNDFQGILRTSTPTLGAYKSLLDVVATPTLSTIKRKIRFYLNDY